MGDILKAVQIAVDIANDDSHGYDQTHRNGPDYDCSSLVAKALHDAGFEVDLNSWTGNLKNQLLACGFKIVPLSDERKPGDIFLNETHHVAMCVDQNTIVQASINEKGTTRGGKTGDQTGKEILVRSFYQYSYGWDYHFTYPREEPVSTGRKIEDAVIYGVLNGKYGVGDERKKKLEKLGYSYEEVQGIINDYYYAKEHMPLILDICAGEYGNGQKRKELLTAAGYDCEKVQRAVNAYLKYF